ncbi:MAG TPA: TSUP family transporter [Chthonomonadales bacterium]|nr:TSUP family transporter [Chthonomonadales bacterium]
MEFLVVGAAALLVSGLTLYSGFGLGTLLMPVFALFFPVEMAVAATAVVHGANSAFKAVAVGKGADRSLVLGFGVPAVLAALVGAACLTYVSGLGAIATYTVGARTAEITPIKLLVAALMLAFAALELSPRLRGVEIGRRHLTLGGCLSGFFGGLSGHQGALRSAFLARTCESPRAFVGTNAVIGLMVDLARTSGYVAMFAVGGQAGRLAPGQWWLILTGTLAAFAGVMLAKRFLHSVTMRSVQTLTARMLVVFALALAAGLI